MSRFYTALLFSIYALVLSAQSDGLRHMHYNITLYGNPFGCVDAQNDPALKDIWFNTVVDHVQPDIITVNEMRDQDFWADRLLEESLNTSGVEEWERAELMDGFSGQSILNACYYRSDRFVLHYQEAIYFAEDLTLLLRPIDFYTFYPIGDAGTSDTTFFHLIVAHLAAGDEDEREDQTEATMARIAELGPGNYIFTGDLNIDGAYEEAFENLVEAPAPIAFIDPLDISDDWNNNPNVSLYHTQSTRTSGDTNGGCFVGGGMDDRFDITLISSAIMDGLLGMSYVEDSYDVIGNDGGNFNQSLPVVDNSDVPPVIASALYEMSDHLPVVTDYMFDAVNVLSENDTRNWTFSVRDGELAVDMGISGEYHLTILDLLGRVQLTEAWSGSYLQTPAFLPVKGVYFIRVESSQGWQDVQRFLN
jgi:hypothetical protein